MVTLDLASPLALATLGVVSWCYVIGTTRSVGDFLLGVPQLLPQPAVEASAGRGLDQVEVRAVLNKQEGDQARVCGRQQPVELHCVLRVAEDCRSLKGSGLLRSQQVAVFIAQGSWHPWDLQARSELGQL